MMTYEEIRVAIETYMATWAGAPIAWDGVPIGATVAAAQSAGTPWIRVTVNDGDSFTAGIGSEPCVRRTGVIQCQIFTARDRGSRPARVIASSLAEHLEYVQLGHLETQAARLINAGPDDNYYQLNVQCGFRAD
jgi:hypothetical protein